MHHRRIAFTLGALTALALAACSSKEVSSDRLEEARSTAKANAELNAASPPSTASCPAATLARPQTARKATAGPACPS